jgi:hypothetical protein
MSLVKVRRNPLTDTIRKALDAVTVSLAAHGVLVNEYQHPGKQPGVEYIVGYGKSGHVVAVWDTHTHHVDGVTWMSGNMDATQESLIEAHSQLYRSMH